MPELLLDEADLHCAQVPAAELGRHVHRVQPERPGLGEDFGRALRCERAFAFDLFFERKQLGANEPAHRVEQQQRRLVGGEVEHQPVNVAPGAAGVPALDRFTGTARSG